MHEHGDVSLYNYAQQHYTNNAPTTPLSLHRKKEFLAYLDTYITRKFDTHISQRVCRSLEQNYCISTAEHHGPLGHPFFFQSALLRGLVHPDTAIINFCTSHVSLGNSSYPRGMIFHGD